MAITEIKNPRLALNDGKPAVREPLRPFNTIGHEEADAAFNVCLRGPLSGYLGGRRTGGYHVEALEAAWCEMFDVRHAVACNSATSGILIACMAMGVGKDTHVCTTPYTMSGTVAPAALLRANILFGDIDSEIFCLESRPQYTAAVVLSVNLFGHPAYPHHTSCPTIEDAAQSILATRNGKRASADITVFSGNVHKAVQCGEGGMCATNNDTLAERMRLARNHGELAGDYPAGLNLRLTEVQAAIWLVQLRKAEKIIARRVEIAEILTEVADAAGIGQAPVIRDGCTHSFYVWALKCSRRKRNFIAKALIAEGFPCKAGYVEPLYKLAAFRQDIYRPNVEKVEASIITYENCGWDPTTKQIKQIGEAFRKVADSL